MLLRAEKDHEAKAINKIIDSALKLSPLVCLYAVNDIVYSLRKVIFFKFVITKIDPQITQIIAD
ncbi:MAG: hypothetical protein B6244_01825 [Candidatus Cloacimonetes bacterium 4572_55]|nr:MAG: hypothetical protein B6244_01825 [Candidatus Cloacimonetes bacterium 4572_55]